MSLNTSEICEKLQSNDRRAKISILESLQQKCLDTKQTSDADVLEVFNDTYLHILNCYSDRYESVRDQAIQCVNMFVERLPPNDFHLVNIVAVLVDRMGKEETVEESEEIRLLIIEQLLNLENRFLTTGNKDSLQDCYKEIVRIIVKALKDPYASVQKQACACIIAIAETADTYVFKPFTETLARGLYGMLNHKHSQARICSVKALGYVALHIDASGEALSRLLMEVSPLLMDSMPLVRRECGELGVRLLLKLHDRYSYFEKLIPLVLCCLKDESSEVQSYILPLWEKCGQQYYEENETELRKKEIADIKPINYPSDVIRPTIGCRGIVQRSLRILKLIMRESNDWKVNVRLHSLKLLYQFVLHAEAAMTAKFFEIYADVAKSLRDSEPTVVQEAVKVSDLMGRLLNYNDWYEHGFEGLERNAKEGYLKCFYYMYTASAGVQYEHNLRLSKMLIEAEFSQTLNTKIMLYCLKIIETILDNCKTDKKHQDSLELYRNCYCATIKVMSLSLECEETKRPELQNKALNILNLLAQLYECEVDDLHEQFFVNALEFVENIDAHLDALSEPILLLNGLLHLAKFRAPYMKQLQQKINIVFEFCADESKVKIFGAVSTAMLDWSKTIRREFGISCDLLKEFLLSVVEPHLVWRAGANAEAMRSLATATVCAVSQGADEEAKIVLPHFAKYITPLLEDQFVATRHYAIKSLCNFGKIDIEHLKPIAYGCLQRLNDPSSGIRILAASVIPKLHVRYKETDTDESKSYDAEVWLTFMKNCFDMLYLHYDNPDERLQIAVRDTIILLTKQYPGLSKDAYERALLATHDCYNLKELKQQLPSL